MSSEKLRFPITLSPAARAAAITYRCPWDLEEGGTIENTPVYARARGSKWFAEWTENDTQLNLVYHDGFFILVR